jgi:threonyl-tRNA synthetase
VGKAIRAAEKQKVPVMCVIGSREASSGTLAVRTYGKGDLGCMAVDEFLSRLVSAVAHKQAF